MYDLSAKAENDIFNNYAYGVKVFGIPAADRYHLDLLDFLNVITGDPLRFPKAIEPFQSFRRAIFRANQIFFKVQEDRVLIVRIFGKQKISLDTFG